MKKLLIATGNKGKLIEIKEYFQDLDLELISLSDTTIDATKIEETAMSFEGNAIIKAILIGEQAKCLTLADDAGLEVDALHGLPGVRSARYAPGTDQDRYRKLLDQLKDVPDEERTARFRAVIAIYDPATKKLRTCAGVCEGMITREPKGDNGFGYDPVFYYPPLGKTEAEMTVTEKNAVSHRGKALAEAKPMLTTEFI